MKITRLKTNGKGKMSVTGTVFDKFIERIKTDTASSDVGWYMFPHLIAAVKQCRL